MRKIILMLFGMLLLCACEKEGDLLVKDLKDASLLSGEENDRKGDQVLGYEKIKEHWVEVDGVNICYTKNGRGKEVIVFVHGLFSTKEDFIPQNQYLCDRARIVMIDLPGHGKSDAPVTDYSMEFYANAVKEVMNEAGAHDAILVCHSLGLGVCRQLILDNPGLVKKLFNIDGAIFHYPPVGDPARPAFIAFIDEFTYNFANPTDDFLRNFIKDAAPPYAPDEAIEGALQFIKNYPWHVPSSTIYELTREEVWEFRPWNTPVLSVYKAEPDYGVEAGLHPGSQVVIVSGHGHRIHIFVPDVINELIEDFVFN